MSLMRRPLNLWLRLWEKRHLARVATPQLARKAFAQKARWVFRPPRGARFSWGEAGGVRCLRIGGPSGDPGETVVFYIHGGAFVMGSPRTHRAMLAHLVKLSGIPAVLPQYGLVPETPFPAGFNDCMAAYGALVATGRRVVLGGDSAGGALALAVLAEILRTDLPRPLGLFAFSPVTDLSFASESVVENAQSDVLLPASRIREMTQMYVPEGDYDDPRVSPLGADFQGAPPVWLTVGDTEILRDDTLRMAARLKEQGVPVEVVVEHDLPHVWPLFHNYLPEARASLGRVAVVIQGWVGDSKR